MEEKMIANLVTGVMGLKIARQTIDSLAKAIPENVIFSETVEWFEEEQQAAMLFWQKNAVNLIRSGDDQWEVCEDFLAKLHEFFEEYGKEDLIVTP